MRSAFAFDRHGLTTCRNLYSISSGVSGSSGLPRRSQQELLEAAAVARAHLHPRRVPERRAHLLDLRVDGGVDPPDEIEDARVLRAAISRYCSVNAMPSSAITARP